MSRLIDTHHPLNVCSASAGTGKTFTLAAYYVGLLLSGVDYRSILAITFTNKATAEMSERILGYLYGIANGGETAFLKRAKEFMIAREDEPETLLRERAGRCFRQMLLDYDNVRVQTIDSFLQTLLSGMAGVLRMSVGLKTELDIDHVISQAVDQLLTTDMTADDRTILEDYMQLKLDQESNWDVRQSLCGMAKELYNEAVQMLDARAEIVFDAGMIASARERLEKSWETNADLQALRQLLAQCNSEKYNRFTMFAYERLSRSAADPQSVAVKDRFRGVGEKQCNADEMAEATLLGARCRNYYNTLQLTLRFSRDMQLMASLQTLIQRNLREANCALLAKTANTLCDALREGDADFILEKAGIRYHHVLIDEFQDTSQLQWSVIRRLLDDVLAGEGNTVLIVGDLKQSIYRWRNGDWHIMASLGSDEAHYSRQMNSSFPPLVRNFRSREEVVQFNLSLFRHIGETLYDEGFDGTNIRQFYNADSEKKSGGFVRFRAFQKRRAKADPDAAPDDTTMTTREAMTMDMFDSMESLLAAGSVPSQLMVLVREKKEAVYITDLHAGLDAQRYPHLSQVSIVSADSFLLEASRAVQTVLYGLRYLANPEDGVAAMYVKLATRTSDALERLQAIDRKTPLYEAVSEIIGQLLCHGEAYEGSEAAYIDSFLDRVRDYVSAYGSRLEDFLEYWDDTLHSKPIAASSTDAIRILTVHASKGLQAQTLFVPFCTWTREAGAHREKIWCPASEAMNSAAGKNLKWLPIQDGNEMAESDYAPYYAEEHRNMQIDNLNMLYVALTRAEDNLYISADFAITSKGELGACNHVGQYLLEATHLSDQIVGNSTPVTADGAPYVEYSAGKPVIAALEAKKADNPFSFAGSAPQESELWSSSAQVRFVQSQEGALYTDYGDEAYRRVARIDEGTLCHEIFAHLRKADELEQVLDMFESRGEIAGAAQREMLKSLISSAWKGSEQMRDWFTAPWELRLEEAIYLDQREIRPDRVMINPETGEAVVLDYKFGGREAKHKQQVGEYMEALRRIGYSPVRGYLWYARENKLVEVG